MYRRRRQTRDIPFSFDSFLDVVANVCGIIIRLILVAWVGARSYHTLAAHRDTPQISAVPAVHAAAVHAEPEICDPLAGELERHRSELENSQQRLLEQLRQHQLLQAGNAQAAVQLTALTASQATLEAERGQLERATAHQNGAAGEVQLLLTDLDKRSAQLAAELRALENLPPAQKKLTYRTPVSRPVHTEELHFECCNGRISYIDIPAFLAEIRRNTDDQANRLKTQWELESTAGPVGSFRLRYTVERERGVLDLGGGAPNPSGGFRYSVTGWVVEPISPARGDAAATALAANSEFRRLVDALDPEQSVVTLWVYADSFALYRQLRDYLHEHNIEVAGRPLPPGAPIASSRRGTASRGQ